MAVLKITKLGNPILRKAAEAVPKEAVGSSQLKRLLREMVETMHEEKGVGIAAPQVNVSKQVAVIEVGGDSRSAQKIPLLVLINPRILAASKELLDGWEGCLSVSDLRGSVPRAQWVDVEALNQKGERVKFHAEGFLARVIQHECDHLGGKLFLDRMANLASLTHLEEFSRFVQED